MDIDRPCIVVRVREPDPLILKEVLAGIEEEGMPYSIDVCEAGDIVKIAYQAAYFSRMGIAIGIEGSRVMLHYSRIIETVPLMDINLKYTERQKARVIGNNAARLYKVMPFRSLEGLYEDSLIESVKARVQAALSPVLDREDKKCGGKGN